jgi:hypothetical protein
MHGNVDGNDIGISAQAGIEFLYGQITTAHRESGPLQQGGRLGQAKGLPPELIGIDKRDVHIFNYNNMLYNLNRKWIICVVLSCKGASGQRQFNVIRTEYSNPLLFVLCLLR